MYMIIGLPDQGRLSHNQPGKRWLGQLWILLKSTSLKMVATGTFYVCIDVYVQVNNLKCSAAQNCLPTVSNSNKSCANSSNMCWLLQHFRFDVKFKSWIAIVWTKVSFASFKEYMYITNVNTQASRTQMALGHAFSGPINTSRPCSQVYYPSIRAWKAGL